MNTQDEVTDVPVREKSKEEQMAENLAVLGRSQLRKQLKALGALRGRFVAGHLATPRRIKRSGVAS